jgi:hypothetical protein
MSEQHLTHWKKLVNPDYIGAYSLEDGKDLTVTILDVKREMITGDAGRKEECTVATLKGQKPMILNRTNCKTIAAIYKTPYIEQWKGKKITLYITTTKLKSEEVECLRIRNTAPQLPELNKQSAKWDGAVNALKSGTVTIAQIEASYYLTPENRELLISESI